MEEKEMCRNFTEWSQEWKIRNPVLEVYGNIPLGSLKTTGSGLCQEEELAIWQEKELLDEMAHAPRVLIAGQERKQCV